MNVVLLNTGRDKFILIAHDWGAAVGFNYVYRYMDTLEKYIMIGGEFQIKFNFLKSNGFFFQLKIFIRKR